jgi:hypothetical protein
VEYPPLGQLNCSDDSLNTGLNTLAAGFAYEVIDHAATQIAADFSGLF